MKLYYTKGACSLAVRITINELGLPCEFEAVDLKAKKTESGADYLKVNPKGAVPALQLDNGKVLTENAVILQYLADTAKATQLLPPIGDFERYHTLEWLNYVATELHKSFGLLFNPTFSQEVKDEVIKPLIKNKLAYLNKHLEKNKYLLGDKYTLPDNYLFVMLNWALLFKFDLKEWPNIYKYFSDSKNRPSISKSLKQEGLELSPA